ncbi:MAG: MmgE/PrpD family protein, partial [Betaproteobacteria bacterium]
MATQAQQPDYLERLARFVGLTPAEAIPESVLERARLILVDSVAVIAAGMRTDELRRLAAAQLTDAAPGRAAVIGLGRRTNRFDA